MVSDRVPSRDVRVCFLVQSERIRECVNALISFGLTLGQHVHLSDNVSPVLEGNNPDTTYARFRLRPTNTSLAGLTPHLNETYSTEEFEAFQHFCAARGVTVSAITIASIHPLSFSG
jgi:hypothetical protein